MRSLTILFVIMATASAFAPSKNFGRIETKIFATEELSPVESFVDDLKMRFGILQSSIAEGSSVKQCIANVLAGEYDKENVRDDIQKKIEADPCVMFTWEASPSCKQAVEAFNVIGADVKIHRLDDPWSEGNPVRAELGKLYGRSSVPAIFINGEYVGGYDGGVSDEKPGIVNLAFKGKLRAMLEEAGALKI